MSARLELRAPRGLEGLVVADTEVSDVDGIAGRYRYRSYDPVELAERRSLEDVWHLLLEGELPTPAEREVFSERLRALRRIPEEVDEVLAAAARPGPAQVDLAPALRSAYSLLAEAFGFGPVVDLDRDALREQALRSCAVLPTLIASLHRRRAGLAPVAPDERLSHAANYLWMLHGERPPPEHARALERYMILTADHGLAASTYAALIVVSTGADVGSALLAALGALSGPLHGGAPDRALEMLDAIGTPARAEPWLRAVVARGERIMGFGHRVYRTEDPRAAALRAVAEQLRAPRLELARHVEAQAVAILDELRPERRLRANVELYGAIVMEHVGVPRPLLSSTFAAARTVGWSAHILEQVADNRLIRPLTAFVGGPLRPVPQPG